MNDKPYEIITLQLGQMQNLVYLIGDKKTRRCAVVDPAWDVPAIFAAGQAKGWHLTDVLLTHSHYDHVNGLDEVLMYTDCAVHLHKTEMDFWGRAGRMAKAWHGGDRIKLGETEITVHHTPGHTPGSCCYHLPGGELITGDTLFIFGCGRCNLPGGDPECMYHSLKKMASHFDPQTLILPGHHYSHDMTATLGQQIEGNPFLRIDKLNDFVDYRMHLHNRSTPYGPVSQPMHD